MQAAKTMHQQQGQAMTEFSVAAAFILVPLFLLIPVLGKYIDVKHKAIQSARYEAWEYIAWNADGNRSINRFKGVPGGVKIPAKTVAQTKLESVNRFYSEPSSTLLNTDKMRAWSSTRLNKLWYDHKGDSLVDTINATNKVSENNTPDVTGVVSTVLNGIDTVAGFIASALSFLGIPAGFTQINGKGNFQSKSKVTLASVDWINPNNDPALAGTDDMANGLSFNQQAAVMSGNWSSAGRAHTSYQAAGLVPTSLLNNPALNLLRQGAQFFLSPEFGPEWLKFGYVNDDAVPHNRVIKQGGTQAGTVACNKSIKSYKYRDPAKTGVFAEPKDGPRFTGIFTPGRAIEDTYITRRPTASVKKFNSCTGSL